MHERCKDIPSPYNQVFSDEIDSLDRARKEFCQAAGRLMAATAILAARDYPCSHHWIDREDAMGLFIRVHKAWKAFQRNRKVVPMDILEKQFLAALTESEMKGY